MSRVKSSYFFSPSQLGGGTNNKTSKAVPPKIDASAASKFSLQSLGSTLPANLREDRPYARKDVYAASDSTQNNYGSQNNYNNSYSNNNNYTTQNNYNSQQNNWTPRNNYPPQNDYAPRDNYANMPNRNADNNNFRPDPPRNLDSSYPVFPSSPAKTPRSGFDSPDFFKGLNAPPPKAPAAPPKQAPAMSPPTQGYSQPNNYQQPSTYANQSTLMPPPAQQLPQRAPSPGLQAEVALDSPNFFSGLKTTIPVGMPRPEVNQVDAGPKNYDSYGTKELVRGAGTIKRDQPKASAPPVQPAAPNVRNEGPAPVLERSPSEPMQQNREPNRYPERSATTNKLPDNPYGNYQPEPPSRLGGRNEARDSEGPLPALTYGKTGYDDFFAGRSNPSSASSAGSRESGYTGGLSTPPSEVSSVINSASNSPQRGKGNNPYATAAYNPYTPYDNDDQPRNMQPKGFTPSVKPYDQYAPSDSASEISVYPSQSRNGGGPPRNNPFSSRGDRDPMFDKPGLTRTGTNASSGSLRPRHSCRGCKQPIVGKSVKASDGRLTGRYHRPCFVCTTCRAPFTSSQVYVHQDKPYCEYHYHTLNRSLCATCDQGIEGQYRETETHEKYHPRCLVCRTCRDVLSDEYFEVNRNVYCERHALTELRRLAPVGFESKDAQGPPGGGQWKAERRKTRLGMMR